MNLLHNRLIGLNRCESGGGSLLISDFSLKNKVVLFFNNIPLHLYIPLLYYLTCDSKSIKECLYV